MKYGSEIVEVYAFLFSIQHKRVPKAVGSEDGADIRVTN